MKLSEGIDAYVAQRHAAGSTYVNGEAVLRSMCRQIGNVSLGRLVAEDLSRFLNNARCSPSTRRGRYSLVRRFLEYWSVRDEVPFLILAIPHKAKNSFLPYVYSEDQLAMIFATVNSAQRGSRLVDARTLRMFLLTLYATGAVFNEVLGIELDQLDFEHCKLRLNGDRRCCRRIIPMCPDLSDLLEQYLQETPRSRNDKLLLFSTLAGQPITSEYIIGRFQRILQIAEISRNDGIQRSPRMQDFRATFAVHRLTAWLKEGADLERLVPSLSAYMGYSSLFAADKYLRLTPDCLIADIDKLSENHQDARTALGRPS